MHTENYTSKPEDEPKQETGEGCSEATCSLSGDERLIRNAFISGCLRYRKGLGDDLPDISGNDKKTVERWALEFLRENDTSAAAPAVNPTNKSDER